VLLREERRVEDGAFVTERIVFEMDYEKMSWKVGGGGGGGWVQLRKKRTRT
jgi:hypothetical protein